MKRILTLFGLFSLILAPLHAQWKTETYTLKGGWNAIYLHGDASYITLDDLLVGQAGSQVLEVWRWNQNPSPVQFTQSPQVQSPGTPEWSVWRRADIENSSLIRLTPRAGYLVKCAGISTDTYVLQIPQVPLSPRTQWVREGANLLSFQTNRTTPASFYSFFSSFQAPIATGTGIFKYLGGELSPTNPLKIFSAIVEPLHRNQAYWFESEIVSDFHGPLHIELTNPDGLLFYSAGSAIQLTLTNKTNQLQTITIAPEASESPPSGQRPISGAVPLSTRAYNAQLQDFETTPLTTPRVIALQPDEVVNLSLVIETSHPSIQNATAGDYFGSLLTITDAGGVIEYNLPVAFEKASLSGLWLGEIDVTHVPYTPKAQAEIVNGVVTEVQLVGRPATGYTTAPSIRISPPAVGGSPATATASIVNGQIDAFTITDGGSGYEKPPSIRISAPPAGASIPVPKPVQLRLLVHRDDGGNFRLLSEAYLGPFESTGEIGLSSDESLLDSTRLGDSARFSVAHLPLNTVNLGSMNGQVLTHTVSIPYTDPTNPFVHQYHPDHDNLDARFETPLPSGIESSNITRQLEFEFTDTVPGGGVTPLGWGVSQLGGMYTETLSGVSSEPITLQGTFQLQRISTIPTLSTGN